ncbi:STN domain-containing protein, partial [Mycobacterium tuberculosis]
QGLTVNRIAGSMEVETALRQLLSGTDLTPVTVGRSIVLKRQQLAAAPSLQRIAQTSAPAQDQPGGAIPPQTNPTDVAPLAAGSQVDGESQPDIIVR